MKLFTLIFLAALLLSSGAQGLKFFGGDTIMVTEPVDDDVVAGGGTVFINAPVDSVIVAGGDVNVNAPIAGDLIALAGNVVVNSDVGGKVVALGGNVQVNRMVGRNALLAGGQVDLGPQSSVGMDAFIAGGSVRNAGSVEGTLSVSAEQFNNSGTAGSVVFQQYEDQKREDRGPDVFPWIVALGFLIVGLILLRLFPAVFQALEGELRPAVVTRGLVGFAVLVLSLVLMVFVAATVIGMPLAGLMILAWMGTFMLSGVFVAFVLGRWLGQRFNLTISDMALYVLGFVVLNVLFALPFLGGLIGLISASLGFGALIYGLNSYRMRKGTAT
ncbi:MAG: hypothetical protein GKC10_09955 [Methanosarcinales archaeon]|nr:hypothetical protein [Methanosarcinales archaeon]